MLVVFKTFNTNFRGMRLKLKKICLMDIRAFGSYYGQTAQLPYASGFGHAPSAGLKRFPAYRAIFIESTSNNSKGYLTVEMADAPGQPATAFNLEGNQLIPLSCTAVLSGSVAAVFVLY